MQPNTLWEVDEADVDICEALIQDQEMYEIQTADWLHQHPLMFEDTNLCLLAKTNSIGKLKLKYLRHLWAFQHMFYWSKDKEGHTCKSTTRIHVIM